MSGPRCPPHRSAEYPSHPDICRTPPPYRVCAEMDGALRQGFYSLYGSYRATGTLGHSAEAHLSTLPSVTDVQVRTRWMLPRRGSGAIETHHRRAQAVNRSLCTCSLEP